MGGSFGNGQLVAGIKQASPFPPKSKLYRMVGWWVALTRVHVERKLGATCARLNKMTLHAPIAT